MSDFYSLVDLLNETPSADDLAWNHALEISGSVYARLKELGISQQELAERMGVSTSRISQIIKGAPGMTLKTIARLECALDFRLDAGFHYDTSSNNQESSFSRGFFFVSSNNSYLPAEQPTKRPYFEKEVVDGALIAA